MAENLNMSCDPNIDVCIHTSTVGQET